MLIFDDRGNLTSLDQLHGKTIKSITENAPGIAGMLMEFTDGDVVEFFGERDGYDVIFQRPE